MAEDVTTRFEPWACGKCGYMMDAATHTEGKAVPEEADLSCCLKCAEPYILHAGKWCPISDDELIALPLDAKAELGRVQHVIRLYNSRKPR